MENSTTIKIPRTDYPVEWNRAADVVEGDSTIWDIRSVFMRRFAGSNNPDDAKIYIRRIIRMVRFMRNYQVTRVRLTNGGFEFGFASEDQAMLFKMCWKDDP